MGFGKSREYIECICNFLDVLNDKANRLKDNKLKNICKLIINYLVSCCRENNIKIKNKQNARAYIEKIMTLVRRRINLI